MNPHTLKSGKDLFSAEYAFLLKKTNLFLTKEKNWSADNFPSGPVHS